MIQVCKVEPGGHCECGFRHICITENLSFLNCIKFKAITRHFKTIPFSSCQLRTCSFKNTTYFATV